MRTPSPLFFLLQSKVATELGSRKIQAKSPKIRAQFANYLHVNDVSNVRAGHIKWQGHHQILLLQQSQSHLHNHTQLIPASHEVQSTQRFTFQAGTSTWHIVVAMDGFSRTRAPPHLLTPAALHNVQFVKYDVTVSFLAQVLDTMTYFVSQV